MPHTRWETLADTVTKFPVAIGIHVSIFTAATASVLVFHLPAPGYGPAQILVQQSGAVLIGIATGECVYFSTTVLSILQAIRSD